jgi:hypothetical protein
VAQLAGQGVAAMNILLRLLGLDATTDVGSIQRAVWKVAEHASAGLLYAVAGLAVALALVNFLPRVRMRMAVRFWTFLLRLGMAGVLGVVLVQLELHLELKARQKPEWVALLDDSGSMATQDAAGGGSRFAAALADLDKVRRSVGDDVKLHVRTLSGAPAGAQPGRGPTLMQDAFRRQVLPAGGIDRVLLLTDGRDTEGRDLKHLGEDLAARGIGLGVRVYGSPKPPNDRGIFVQAQRPIVRLGEEVLLRGSISGLAGAEPLAVLLKENGKVIRPITVAPQERAQFWVSHTPAKEGSYSYTLELPQADSLALNNAYTVKVQVVRERIKVFMVEGFPRFEFKLMKVALEVDPMVDLTTLVHIPGGGVYVQGKPLHHNVEQGLITSQAELFQYDVVVLRDVSRKYFREGGDVSESRLRNLVEFVTKRGGGLVVLGGQDVFRAGGYEDSALMEVLPFDLSDHFSKEPQFEGMFYAGVPKAAQGHPILRLLSDPARNRERLAALRQLDGCNNVGRFRPLATPLMTGAVKIRNARGELEDREVPLLAYQPVGDGKVVAGAADTFWRWQLQAEFDDPPLQKLLANIVRFIAPPPRRKPGAPDVRLADGSPQVGQELLLSTTLKDRNFDPIRNAELQVTVTRPDASQRKLYPRDLPEQPGLYEYRVPLEQVGPYTVQARYGKEASETSFLVEGSASEYADLSPDPAAMKALAAAAGGKVIESLDDWLGQVDTRSAVRPAVRDLAVWNSPAVVGLFILLVCADCYLRKRQGLP